MRDVFILKRGELQQRVDEEQRRLERVEELLKKIEKEGTMPDYQVVIKKVAPQIIASIREVLPAYGDLGRLYEALIPYVFSQGGKPAGPTLFICYDAEYKEKDVDVEAGIPLAGTIPGSDRVKVYELPGVAEAACTVYKGPYEGITEAYQAIMSWAEGNGYQISGPDREWYLVSPADTQDPAEYVTEIQFPVMKA
jgi:effector-binding domain-containing protein